MDWQNEYKMRVKQKVEGETFTSEDIVLSMEEDGIQFPEERRIIGPAAIRQLKNEGWIEKDGFADAKRSKVHKANLQEWKRTNKQQ